jgi:hypothetical protein
VRLRPRHASLIGGGPRSRLRQLGDVGGDAPGLVAGEEVRRRATARLNLEVDVGQRLPVASRTVKQASVSSAVQGGGKQRDGMAPQCQT